MSRYLFLWARFDSERPSGLHWFHWETADMSQDRDAMKFAAVEITSKTEAACLVYRLNDPPTAPDSILFLVQGQAVQMALAGLLMQESGRLARCMVNAWLSSQRTDAGDFPDDELLKGDCPGCGQPLASHSHEVKP